MDKKITSKLDALHYVLHHGLFLCNVPKQFVTTEVCLAAIYCNPHALQHVPSWLMSEHLCYVAVNLNGAALEHVPKEFMSEHLCHLAIETERCQGEDYTQALSFVPREFMSRSLCLKAVERNSMSLKHVPYEFQFPEICLAAVRNCEPHMLGELLGYVEDKDRSFWLSALLGDVGGLKNNPLEFLPEPMRSKKMCMAAVKACGLALEFVPSKLKTREMCIAALNRDGRALEFVPKKLQSEMRKLFGWVGRDNEAP